MNNKVLLMILDGWGNGHHDKADVISTVHPEYISAMTAKYPHAELRTDGENVGLPDGQMGNSEVGHTNIGGGRVVFQDLPRISRAIEDGTFFENPAYNAAMDACLEKGTALHLYGLLSNGGVHSTVEHVWALLKMAGIKGLKRVSRPGLRQYASVDKMPRVLNGLGIAIVSTSKGIMTDAAARRENVGGEVLCYIY